MEFGEYKSTILTGLPLERPVEVDLRSSNRRRCLVAGLYQDRVCRLREAHLEKHIVRLKVTVLQVWLVVSSRDPEGIPLSPFQVELQPAFGIGHSGARVVDIHLCPSKGSRSVGIQDPDPEKIFTEEEILDGAVLHPTSLCQLNSLFEVVVA
ncbi:hypothetical protein DSECCO2_497660 [anaerobic digester metagenome]